MPIVYRTLGNFDYIAWKAPVHHYLHDRLAEAHAEASRITVGITGEYLSWYRMIEAEWLTRSSGQIVKINDRLQVEHSGEREEIEQLGVVFASICGATARRFEVTEQPSILISVLTEEADAPWVDARAGYFIDKFPYGKICIPYHALSSQEDLVEVLSHEYAHALNLAITQGKCPLWLNEGIAMLSERGLSGATQRAFTQNQIEWKDAHHLDAAFHAELNGLRDYPSIHRAYQQAAWIVRYLVHCGGFPAIGKLMHGFTDNSLLEELKMRLTSEEPAEEALRQIYNFGEKELFDRALEWLHSLR